MSVTKQTVHIVEHPDCRSWKYKYPDCVYKYRAKDCV